MLGVGFGRYVWRPIVLLVPVRVSYGRCVWERFRLILSLVRTRYWIRILLRYLETSLCSYVLYIDIMTLLSVLKED